MFKSSRIGFFIRGWNMKWIVQIFVAPVSYLLTNTSSPIHTTPMHPALISAKPYDSSPLSSCEGEGIARWTEDNPFTPPLIRLPIITTQFYDPNETKACCMVCLFTYPRTEWRSSQIYVKHMTTICQPGPNWINLTLHNERFWAELKSK